MSAKVEDARCCLFALQCAKEVGPDRLVAEGDCLSLI